MNEVGCTPTGAFGSSTDLGASGVAGVDVGLTFSFCATEGCETGGFGAKGFGSGAADLEGVVNSS